MVAAVRMVRNTVPRIADDSAEKKWMTRVLSPLQMAEIRVFGKIIDKEYRVHEATIPRQDTNALSQSNSNNKGR